MRKSFKELLEREEKKKKKLVNKSCYNLSRGAEKKIREEEQLNFLLKEKLKEDKLK